MEELFAGVPLNRAADLTARFKAGHLTALEALALSVLRGGPAGEECTPALLDEAIAAYAHGSYRVPVRVVADWRRTKMVFTFPADGDPAEWNRVAGESVRRWRDSPEPVALVIHSGCKLDVYECAADEAPGVTVKEGDGNG